MKKYKVKFQNASVPTKALGDWEEVVEASSEEGAKVAALRKMGEDDGHPSHWEGVVVEILGMNIEEAKAEAIRRVEAACARMDRPAAKTFYYQLLPTGELKDAWPGPGGWEDGAVLIRASTRGHGDPVEAWVVRYRHEGN